jgi:quinol monooxygenase YgiN
MPQDATPLALVVRFTVLPGAEAEFDALVAETAAGIRDHEPGTLTYACHTVQDRPRERVFYELYRDRAAFQAHESTEHTRRFLTRREPLLEATEVDFLALADGKTPVTGQVANAEA